MKGGFAKSNWCPDSGQVGFHSYQDLKTPSKSEVSSNDSRSFFFRACINCGIFPFDTPGIFCLGLHGEFHFCLFLPRATRFRARRGQLQQATDPGGVDKRGASNNDKRHKTASTNAPQRMTASGAVLAMALFAAIDTSAGFGLAPTPISYGLQRWSAATRRIDLSQRAAAPGLPSSRRSRLPLLAMSVADDDGEQPRVLVGSLQGCNLPDMNCDASCLAPAALGVRCRGTSRERHTHTHTA